MMDTTKKRLSPVFTIIILFGLISMFGDIIYESARSANSQYLNLLGISAAKIGLIFGLGEFLGYFLRLVAGVLSDKSGKHWLFMFVGYGMLIAVPVMGLTLNWNLLFILILMERIGKALRSPAKDTILSKVSEHKVGVGFAFGFQEAIDQIGAFLGPLIFTFIFYVNGKEAVIQYQTGYKVLIIPFILLMGFLYYVYRRVNQEKIIQLETGKGLQAEKIKPIFWIYTAFTFFCALGLVNFSVIGYHLKANNLVSDGNITLLYSTAMVIDAGVALLVGKAYDQIKKRTGNKTSGLLILMAIPMITILLPFTTLSRSIPLIIVGMIAFGIIIGTHETIMRSSIADITPINKRGTGFGVFNTVYGLALLGGSSLMGWLYDLNQIGIIMAFTGVAEVIALALYFKMNTMVKSGK
jgi:MFS family permease